MEVNINEPFKCTTM